MTYEQANTWFKLLHEQEHKRMQIPMNARLCLVANCGNIWRYILYRYQDLEVPL